MPFGLRTYDSNGVPMVTEDSVLLTLLQTIQLPGYDDVADDPISMGLTQVSTCRWLWQTVTIPELATKPYQVILVPHPLINALSWTYTVSGTDLSLYAVTQGFYGQQWLRQSSDPNLAVIGGAVPPESERIYKGSAQVWVA